MVVSLKHYHKIPVSVGIKNIAHVTFITSSQFSVNQGLSRTLPDPTEGYEPPSSPRKTPKPRIGSSFMTPSSLSRKPLMWEQQQLLWPLDENRRHPSNALITHLLASIRSFTPMANTEEAVEQAWACRLNPWV